MRVLYCVCVCNMDTVFSCMYWVFLAYQDADWEGGRVGYGRCGGVASQEEARGMDGWCENGDLLAEGREGMVESRLKIS